MQIMTAAVIALALLGNVGQLQDRTEQYTQADVLYGSRIYAGQCSVCHGAAGDAIGGIDMRAGRFRRVASDADLRSIVTTGIPGTGMVPFNFDASELAALVAYIRNMRDFGARAVALGDAERGRAVFEGAGACRSCHRVNGHGALAASDLSDIGAIRSAEALERSLLDPNASMPPRNRSVRAVTRSGRLVGGRRLNEDTYTVQLIDAEERLVSLVKADLREYQVIPTSSMPSYKDKLGPEELADLLAFLLSLRGLQ